jgi:rubrerythrin
MAGATLIAPLERLTPPNRPRPARTYTCPECGHVLRVSGLERHRVYFELDDERSSDPVMNRVCPQCGHGLPGKNAPWIQP